MFTKLYANQLVHVNDMFDLSCFYWLKLLIAVINDNAIPAVA